MRSSATIASELIDGVTYMHSQGVSHGDLHDENVMLGHNGVKIIDVLYRGSLAQLTTVSRDVKLRKDINDLRNLLVSILRHTDLPAEKVAKFSTQVYETDALKAMAELIAELSKEVAAAPGPAPFLPSIRDHALATKVFEPTTLARYNQELGHDLDPEVLAEQVPVTIKVAERVRRLPIPTRELLSVVIGRLRRRTYGHGNWEYEHFVPQQEIVAASGLTAREVAEHVRIMDRHGIATLRPEDVGEGEVMSVSLREEGYWFIWGDIREFCEKTGTDLNEFIVKLRFNLFD